MGNPGLRAVSGRSAWIHARSDQLLLGAGKAVKFGRIDAIRQIEAQRTNRRAVANAKTHGMHHVIEVL